MKLLRVGNKGTEKPALLDKMVKLETSVLTSKI